MYKAVDKRLLLTSQRFLSQKAYWENKLSGDTSGKPAFYTPGNRRETRGNPDTTQISLPSHVCDRLMKLSSRSNLTIYIVLLAALNALIYRYSNNSEDIFVVSPPYAPNVTEDTINDLLLIRNTIHEETIFKELLLQVSQSVQEAYENQDYPFDQLIKSLVKDSQLQGEEILPDTICLLKNIHIRKSMESLSGKIIFSFEREEDRVKGNIEYDPSMVERNHMEQISRHYSNILEALVEDINIKISDVLFLSEQDRKQLIFDFNNTTADYPRGRTIHELFEEQAERRGDRIAVFGMEHGTWSMESISYNELNKKSDELAYLLREKAVNPDTVVAIMVEPSIQMIYGILSILKAGGAYLPIALDYPEQRKQYMLAESASNVLLTTRSLSERIAFEKEITYLENEKKPATRNSQLATSSGNLAYIIYTSGSTGDPKGVMVEHKNVVRLVKNTNYIEFEENGRLLRTGALEFDASTFEIWGALLNGLTLYTTSKEDIITPLKLKETVQKYRIDTMWLTAPLFNQLSSEDIEIFDGLKNLLVGGDVLSSTHINRVRRRFSRLNIINGYGPTENTTFSTTFSIRKEYEENIPIGKPISNSTAYIVGKSNQLAPIGVVGELVVGGDGVARGYLNNPELTADKFDQDFQDDQDEKEKAESFHHSSFITHHSSLYRTGDLARWLPDGNIEFLGRIDHQVKIRGFRIEMGEIEHQLLKHNEVKEAVVICKNDHTGGKYLCAYIVGTGAAPNIQGLKEYLSQSLPDFMIPTHFVLMEEIPLTRNGKVDRRALPVPEVGSGEGDIVKPRNEIEEKLVEIWSEVLGIAKESISIDSNFFDLGGHSLKINILIARIHKAFNVKIELADVFMIQTIEELAEYISGAETDIYAAIEPAPKREYYALSSAQKRLYFLNQRDLDDTSYNMPMVLILEQGVNRRKLKSAFSQLIARHDSLRTSFVMINEEPVQRINDEVVLAIDYYETPRDGAVEEIVKNFVKPFDLSQAPLLRVGLIKETGKKCIMIVDMHHIITDGTSQDLLASEFAALYTGRPLPPLTLQYKDYSEWQNTLTLSEKIKKQEDYWLNQFEDHIPILNLPIDYPRPVHRDSSGVRIYFKIETQLVWKLKKLALKADTTLYTVLLAAYTLLLSKITNQEDIVVGSPVSGRTHADLHNIIGLFANMLPMRNKPREDKYFSDFLEEVKINSLKAFENQDFQFDQLVTSLKIKRDPGRHPLFDTVIALQNMDSEEVERKNLEALGNLKVVPYPSETLDVQHDLLINAEERDGKLHMMLEYAAALFKRSTAEDIQNYFIEILEQISGDDNLKLKEIQLSHDSVSISVVEEEEGDFMF
jgi:acyl carrier protein